MGKYKGWSGSNVKGFWKFFSEMTLDASRAERRGVGLLMCLGMRFIPV